MSAVDWIYGMGPLDQAQKGSEQYRSDACSNPLGPFMGLLYKDDLIAGHVTQN